MQQVPSCSLILHIFFYSNTQWHKDMCFFYFVINIHIKKVRDMRFIITVRHQLSYNRQFLINVLQFNFSFTYTKNYCGLVLPPTKKRKFTSQLLVQTPIRYFKKMYVVQEMKHASRQISPNYASFNAESIPINCHIHCTIYLHRCMQLY